jgi:Protein of unknown function (DUF2628)
MSPASDVTSGTKPNETVPLEDLICFASGEYYEKRARGLYGGKKFLGFNFSAAIFGMAWCFYRKRYVIGIALVLTEALIGILAMAIYFAASDSESTVDPHAKVVSYVTVIVVRLGFGFLANRLYFRSARRAIVRIKEKSPNGKAAPSEIASRGGTSDVAMFIAFLISGAMRVADAFIAP